MSKHGEARNEAGIRLPFVDGVDVGVGDSANLLTLARAGRQRGVPLEELQVVRDRTVGPSPRAAIGALTGSEIQVVDPAEEARRNAWKEEFREAGY